MKNKKIFQKLGRNLLYGCYMIEKNFSGNSNENIAQKIEHTLLGENISYEQILAHLEDAKNLKVLAVCIPLEWVAISKKILLDTNIKIVTVIDFPLGQSSKEEKILQTIAANALGADEIDMVLDYQALIDKEYKKVLNGIKAVVKNSEKALVKVIIETSALNKEQIAIACSLVALAKAHFIKTSTGFHKLGAQVQDIKLMRDLLPKSIKIKASGGIKTYQYAQELISAGADRIGCSKSKQIIQMQD